MTLQQLALLLAVTDHGSFSEAALELGLTQSSVSYGIAELERELGARLFERGRHGARPTPLGARVAEHARRMHRLTDVIRQEAALESGAVEGDLHVATFRSVASRVLPALLADMAGAAPGIRVRIEEADGVHIHALEALHSGRADVAFALLGEAGGHMAWELFRDPYVALLPPRLHGLPDPLPLERLLSEPFVLYGVDDDCCRPLMRAATRVDPAFAPTHEVHNDSTIVAMVAAGLGVTVMPELTIDAVPESVRKVALAEPLERTIAVAVMPESLKVPAVRIFLDRLRRRYPEGGVPPLALGERVGRA